jgi:homoaconitase/3-isopropylmalate dehydratase large subunit
VHEQPHRGPARLRVGHRGRTAERARHGRPGSARVRLEAEAEGLDKVFTDFGASGASPAARCASA